ncbi:MAG: response regulator [Candidatus Obscuribacterales bacterium]|nr:MAG: response regulator [Candidatus Melainabacteria bacterium]
MTINWNNHIDRLRSQIADLRNTLRVIKTKAHDERPGLEETTAQLRELVDKNESQKTLYQFPKILHKILHNPAVGAIILGPNGEHLLFNAAAERLLGSDLMADALAEKTGNFGFYQTDKITKYTKEELPWQQAVMGAQVPEVDLFVRRQGYADGLWIKVTSTALKSDSNDIGGAVVFLVDITEQVQVENQIQSTCEALEQQISQIGSAQLELQLLTEKLGKLDYLPVVTPDTVTTEKSHKKKTAAQISHEKSSKVHSNSKDTSTDQSSTPTSQFVSGSDVDSHERQTTTTEGDLKTSTDASGSKSNQDSSIIDYASDELAKWADIAPDEEGEDQPAGATEPGQNKIKLASQAELIKEIHDFAASAESEEDTESTETTKTSELKEPTETLEDKAQKVNESIVQQLTTEIFAIANQIEPAETSGHQEFFAPDNNQQSLSVPGTAEQSAAGTTPPKTEELNVASVQATSQESDKDSSSPNKPTPKPGEADTGGTKRQKILIVDDIPVNQKLLRLQLKRLGFECDAANNGDAAQKAVANGDFALVLMDLDMPIMDGFESTAAIRKNEQGLGKRIPIVAMTSYDRQEDRDRCLAAGMDDFLSKGATQKQLHEVVERCMQAASKESVKTPITPPEPPKETGLDIESLQKQFDKEEVQDVSRLFLSAVNTFIDCIQLGIEEKDAGAVTHFAHSVKGPCAALGIDEMTRLTSEIMSDAEAGNWTQVRVKYMKLKSSFGEVRDQLRELCTPGYV